MRASAAAPGAGDLHQAATEWLTESHLELRNGANAPRMAYFHGAVDVLKDIGVLNAVEQDGWIARAKQCPGHDDEGGRGWCAYGCEFPRASAAGGGA